MRVSEVVTRMLQSKSARGHRQNYLKELERVCIRFAESTGDPPIDGVLPDQVEAFVFRSTSAGGQATTRSRLSALFSFANRTRLSTNRPLESIPDTLQAESKPPEILTPAQVRLILSANRANPRALAWVCLGLFAGLRPCEASRSTWDDIRLDSSTLIVHGRNSKTRRHRIIELHETARAWLALAKSLDSELPISHQPIRRSLRRMRDCLSLPTWPQDVLRHSCASYALAISQDFTRTAWQLGNSEKILLRHYYRLTDRQSAEAFWNLTPAALESSQLLLPF